MNIFNLHEGVRAWLSTATTKQIGLSRVPTTSDELNGSDLEMPYATISPLSSTNGQGSWHDPEEERDFLYNIVSVGEDPRQVAWLQSKILDAFTARNANGSYANPIVIAGLTVEWVATDELGAILPTGVDLFNAVDIYRIRVGA